MLYPPTPVRLPAPKSYRRIIFRLASAGSRKHGVPVPPLSLDAALDLARHPAAVEVARLRLHLLAVDVALPGAGVEGEIAGDGLVAVRGGAVGADAVHDHVVGVGGAHDGVVGGGAFELAVCRLSRLG